MRSLLSLVLLLALAMPLSAQVKVEVVTDEAEAVLAILAKVDGGLKPEEGDWKRLFQSEGYLRLVAREARFENVIKEEMFREFVLGKDLRGQTAQLSRTLQAWRSTDMEASARKALAYLPPGARIQASVYPVIKPWKNSFVFEGKSIFMFLDPARSRERFENTLVHELHHIGLDSLPADPARVAALANLPESVRAANNWVAGFGEGFAMLAAAGSPTIHPHATSPDEDRQRWDRDMANFDKDLKAVEAFLLAVAEGRLKDQAAGEQGMAFFGIQGPWYTVGWRMAALIEQHLGRPTLLDCMRDTRKLLPAFNQAVAKAKLDCATWSPLLLARLAGKQPA